MLRVIREYKSCPDPALFSANTYSAIAPAQWLHTATRTSGAGTAGGGFRDYLTASDVLQGRWRPGPVTVLTAAALPDTLWVPS
jgi:hypothetical protein